MTGVKPFRQERKRRNVILAILVLTPLNCQIAWSLLPIFDPKNVVVSKPEVKNERIGGEKTNTSILEGRECVESVLLCDGRLGMQTNYSREMVNIPRVKLELNSGALSCRRLYAEGPDHLL
jgi:hypothetical protein